MDFNEDVTHFEYQMCSVSVLTELQCCHNYMEKVIRQLITDCFSKNLCSYFTDYWIIKVKSTTDTVGTWPQLFFILLLCTKRKVYC